MGEQSLSADDYDTYTGYSASTGDNVADIPDSYTYDNDAFIPEEATITTSEEDS